MFTISIPPLSKQEAAVVKQRIEDLKGHGEFNYMLRVNMTILKNYKEGKETTFTRIGSISHHIPYERRSTRSKVR